MFSEHQLDDIHFAALEVLDKTGVFIEDEQVREIMDGGGARVDPDTGVAQTAQRYSIPNWTAGG